MSSTQTATAAPGRVKLRRPRLGPLGLSLPGVAAMTIFLIVPLVTFAIYSFLTPTFFNAAAPLTGHNYSQAFSSSLNHTLARNSAIIGLVTAAASVLLGLPIAYWLRFVAGRMRNPVLFAIVTSMFAGYLVRIYSWRTILGTNGLLNRALEDLGVISKPLGFLIFDRFAVIVALVHIVLPYVVLVLYAALIPVNPALLEVATDLGARPMQRWRRVVLPLVAAPMATTAVFVVIHAASDYVTPQVLGGTNGQMIGVPIQTEFTSLGNWSLGAATSFLVLIAFLVCYGLTALALRIAKLDRLRVSA